MNARNLPVAILLLLLVVLVPGIGHSAKGSVRWLGFGPAAFQPVREMICICFNGERIAEKLFRCADEMSIPAAFREFYGQVLL